MTGPKLKAFKLLVWQVVYLKIEEKMKRSEMRRTKEVRQALQKVFRFQCAIMYFERCKCVGNVLCGKAALAF